MFIPDNNQNSHPEADGGNSIVSLLTEYAPLVKSRALSFLHYGCELDDLIQEGNIGLLSASLKYNRRLSAFATFARRCIDSSIIDYLRKSRGISHIPDEMLIDISGVEVADSSPDPEHSVSIKDEYTRLVERARLLLSAYEFAVFSDIIRGYSYGEIAEKNGAQIKSVRNAVQRIRAKLKQLYLPR